MIIVNFKLWLFAHVVLPILANVLIVSIMVASITMLILYVIEHWKKEKRRVRNE